MAESIEKSATLEAPRGVLTSRIDDKGRMKVPATLKEYLNGLGERSVFITSLDMSTIRVYPISVWRENEKFFDGLNEEAEDGEDVAFLAQDFGQEVEMDSQGRLLIPSDLRKFLDLENKPVYLNSYRGRINIYGKEVYEARRARARAKAAEKLRSLEKKGLK